MQERSDDAKQLVLCGSQPNFVSWRLLLISPAGNKYELFSSTERPGNSMVQRPNMAAEAYSPPSPAVLAHTQISAGAARCILVPASLKTIGAVMRVDEDSNHSRDSSFFFSIAFVFFGLPVSR